jgi:hypothetical protein
MQKHQRPGSGDADDLKVVRGLGYGLRVSVFLWLLLAGMIWLLVR